MRLLLSLLFTFAFAATAGLGATWFVATRGLNLGAITIGAWTAAPRSGTVNIDPFARAAVARSGALPLGSGDGIAFLARGDDAGNALDGRCDVTISGTTPLARYWTLTLYDPEGRPAANAIGRHGFTSREVVRRADGSFMVVAAPRARPGNWLPTGGIERFVLVLRLYDTPVGVGTRTDTEFPMPAISVGACL